MSDAKEQRQPGRHGWSCGRWITGSSSRAATCTAISALAIQSPSIAWARSIELIEGNCPRGSAAHKGVIGELADPSEIAPTVVFSDELTVMSIDMTGVHDLSFTVWKPA